MGGGVWRLKLFGMGAPSSGSFQSCQRLSHEYTYIAGIQSYLILASCMHAGARILRLTCSDRSVDTRYPGKWSIEILAEFKEHESMNYESDIARGTRTADQESEEAENSSFVCVSSSFYDRRLCVWRTHV